MRRYWDSTANYRVEQGRRKPTPHQCKGESRATALGLGWDKGPFRMKAMASCDLTVSTRSTRDCIDAPPGTSSRKRAISPMSYLPPTVSGPSQDPL